MGPQTNLPGWIKWGTGVLVSSLILGAAAGCGTSETQKDSAPAATEEKAEAPKPEPPDTGRMSSGEFDSFTSAHADFVSEVQDYGRQLGGKCATLATNSRFDAHA